MMLYLVKFMKKLSYSDNWFNVESYAVGNTPNEAIEFVKRKFRGYDSDFKNFNATAVSEYADRGNFKLYRVKYNEWNMSFSNTHMEDMLVVGRCEDEAICYAKAYASADAMSFMAAEIDKVNGHTILVQQ